MKYHVVTTTNIDGWNQTGRRMAESFVRHWPAEAAPLTVYAEGFEAKLPGVVSRDLPGWMDEFKAKHYGDRTKRGFRNDRYDYRFDAVKFAHKVAALTDFGENLTDGVMVWLDIDTITHAKVSVGWLQTLFPAPAYLAWLDRKNAHPECGVVFYRCSHPYHRTFMQAFRSFYTEGTLFNLPEWHDSYVLQHLVMVKAANQKIPVPVSLSGAGARTSHPAVNGPLSACFDHFKGDRKQQGRTPPRERFLVRDGNPYWNV